MWQSIKTISRDMGRAQRGLEDTIEDYERECQLSFQEVLLEIKEMRTNTENNFRELFLELDSLKKEISDIDRNFSKMRTNARQELSTVREQLESCTKKVANTSRAIENFADDVDRNFSMLDEGTRLIITNMLLDELGGK